MDRETLDFSTSFFQDFENSPEDFPRDRVDFINKSDSFTYSQFFRDYLLPNRPCVFSAEFTKDWSSRKFWVTQDGKPDLERLLQEFQGAAPVPVANCDLREYNSHPKELLPFPEFVEYWREFISNGHRSSRGCLYLKDWHLSRAFPEREFYSIPVYFSSDWLNEYWDAVGADDFRFVYMGPKGSWTPFHADVFRSYSWSANVCGRKRWLLYPPGEERFLTDTHGNLPFDLTAPEFRDPRIYPRSGLARAPLEIIQEAGEIVFVPSGWHHQVHNLVREFPPGIANSGMGIPGFWRIRGEKVEREMGWVFFPGDFPVPIKVLTAQNPQSNGFSMRNFGIGMDAVALRAQTPHSNKNSVRNFGIRMDPVALITQTP
uniref:2-oxoglutarate and iron-dependent oxygenase JMJD4 n=1 Tax=Cyanistes caeruleus TaxID=156563 RepID=A0A8C0UJG0_CYACU